MSRELVQAPLSITQTGHFKQTPREPESSGMVMRFLRLGFSFFGLINRLQYWIGMAIAYGMFGVAMGLWLLDPESKEWSTIVGLWVVVWLISMFSLMSKRLHDLNISVLWLPAVVAVYALAMVLRQPMLETALGAMLGLGIILLGCFRSHGPEMDVEGGSEMATFDRQEAVGGKNRL
jgi:uncharacterized membrane protein YhaH (DUF805 family)